MKTALQKLADKFSTTDTWGGCLLFALVLALFFPVIMAIWIVCTGGVGYLFGWGFQALAGEEIVWQGVALPYWTALIALLLSIVGNAASGD